MPLHPRTVAGFRRMDVFDRRRMPVPRRYSVLTLILFSLALALGVACCYSSLPPPPPAEPRSEEHAHKPGSHGGSIVAIGRDNYHAEAIFEKGGVLRLLLLGKDEAQLLEVESQTLTAYA